MHRDLPLDALVHSHPKSTRKVEVAAVLFAVAAILLWYWQTSVSVVTIWYRSETFAHGFVILPIVGFLIWRDRQRLAGVPTRPYFPALVPLALAGFVWVFAELASVLGLAQFMVAAMIPLVVWTIMGTAMLRALAFPLAFMFFAIPFGEFLMPQLIDWTADFTIAALRLTGIPVYREANSFVIPSGHWSVVEACSGIRYLIASMVVGTLYAYLTYRSRTRRLVFIAASIVVPLVANWLRAYMIVMIGHLSNNTLATGVDHIIYGWIFFGVVMAVLFWVASFWRQDNDPPDTATSAVSMAAATAPVGRVVCALALALVVVAMWKPALAMLERQSDGPIHLPEVAVANGWTTAPPLGMNWSPAFTKPAAESRQAFVKDDMQVEMYVAYYRGHATQGKLVSSGNILVRSTKQPWLEVAVTKRDVRSGNDALSLPVTEYRSGVDRLLATRWYVVDGIATTSDQVAALRSGWQRLMGRGDDGAIVVAYTRVSDAGTPAIDKLDAFAVQMGDQIRRALATVERP